VNIQSRKLGIKSMFRNAATAKEVKFLPLFRSSSAIKTQVTLTSMPPIQETSAAAALITEFEKRSNSQLDTREEVQNENSE
jgi:hypothetical protein